MNANLINENSIVSNLINIYERFGFKKVTKAEMEQLPNLKKMLIFGNERDAESLRKVCDPLGIEVEPMACTSV